MVINDKQELRRCVKQTVRRAEVSETSFNFDVADGELGVANLLLTWAQPEATLDQAVARACAGSALLSEDASVTMAALNALGFPVDDMERAQAMERGYDREAYLALVLSAMRAKHVLVKTPLSAAEQISPMDERFAPLFVVEQTRFAPGRYGVDYAEIARHIAHTIEKTGARDVMLEAFDEPALDYCLMPVCEDERAVLHVSLHSSEEIEALIRLLKLHPQVRVLAHASAQSELLLIEAATENPLLLVRLSDMDHLPRALARLGTRFIPYASEADLPETMLGRWVRAREAIWPALVAAYLPLARAGLTLTSDRIENDVNRLFTGNLRLLYL